VKRNPKPTDEPGVAEVRRWRAKLWKQGGGTLRGVMALLRDQRAARTTKRPARARRRSA
jgi:hypothetical protein